MRFFCLLWRWCHKLECKVGPRVLFKKFYKIWQCCAVIGIFVCSGEILLWRVYKHTWQTHQLSWNWCCSADKRSIYTKSRGSENAAGCVGEWQMFLFKTWKTGTKGVISADHRGHTRLRLSSLLLLSVPTEPVRCCSNVTQWRYKPFQARVQSGKLIFASKSTT